MDFNDDDEFVAVAVIVALLFGVHAVRRGRGNADAGDDSDNEDGHFVGMQEWERLHPTVFEENFRMTPDTFKELARVIQQHLLDTNRLHRLRTSVEHSVLFAVWVLANPDSFRTTALQFLKAKSSIHFDYVVIIECLRELAGRFIRWPDARERDEIKVAFENRYGYPGVIGCIDGTNITITAPLERGQRRRYIDRHHKYSVIAQAVCDHNMLYRDIFVGQPGSVGDARTFSRSPLSRNLLLGEPYIAEDEHLLGDGAYALLNQVIKPFLDDGDLDPRRKLHNRVLSAARATIERSFALLKNKFRRLIKRFQVYSTDYRIDTIVASFVLHNFILLDGEDCPGIPPAAGNEMPGPAVFEESRVLGSIKRDVIADYLYAERLRNQENAEADEVSESDGDEDEAEGDANTEGEGNSEDDRSSEDSASEEEGSSESENDSEDDENPEDGENSEDHESSDDDEEL